MFLQNTKGGFNPSNVALFESDMASQDENACFFDADMDGDLDLYVVSGAYLTTLPDQFQDRLYLNDGKGHFTKAPNNIPKETYCGAVAVPFDVDDDDDLDLFIGNRMLPGQYPMAPPSQLLINDGQGVFTNQIASVANGLEHAGMITDALATDLNKDGAMDLIEVGRVDEHQNHDQ
ncbi:MAG: VCBS repeat-containing protein [Saprospiraceae bacterium]|nr:VCBS repeat-containing protein [Saprospiraceae bacterium]